MSPEDDTTHIPATTADSASIASRPSAGQPHTAPVGVFNEYSPLRTVMVHRPGSEMARLTPDNRFDLLFDEVLWVERAEQQHDSFVQLLRGAGAEVLELRDLLIDVLDIPDARQEVLERTLDASYLGAIVAADMHEAMAELPSAHLADALIGGVTIGQLAELGVQSGSIVLHAHLPHDFVLNPLPNHMFTRDSSAWVGNSVTVSAMHHPARRRESVHVHAIYRHHPRFADGSGATSMLAVDPRYRSAATVEGGDVMVLSPGVVAMGLSERTSAVGVEYLASRLLTSGTVERVIAVALPHQRAMMHLDTVTTVLDEESMVRYGPLGMLETFEIELRGGRVHSRARSAEDMDRVLAAGMGVPSLRVLTAPLDPFEAAREQWDDGCNVVAVAPGTVIAYERAVRTNEYLRSHGIEVLELAGDELGRGRGGPRCMTCPMWRA